MTDVAIPVELQVVGSALRAVAEEMGAVLIRAAFSSNIKERRDCSTALFDGAGRMVVQAEHIPVHLGAMPEAVAAVMAHDPRPGEVWALNDPYTGGTHLPDITLVTRTGLGFAVSRAHHADVGGMEPASLPANSTELYQEGLIIPPTRLDDGLLGLIAANSRNPDERRGDLRAQLAATGSPTSGSAARATARPRARRGGHGRIARLLGALRPLRYCGSPRRALRGDGRDRGRGGGRRQIAGESDRLREMQSPPSAPSWFACDALSCGPLAHFGCDSGPLGRRSLYAAAAAGAADSRSGLAPPSDVTRRSSARPPALARPVSRENMTMSDALDALNDVWGGDAGQPARAAPASRGMSQPRPTWSSARACRLRSVEPPRRRLGGAGRRRGAEPGLL